MVFLATKACINGRVLGTRLHTFSSGLPAGPSYVGASGLSCVCLRVRAALARQSSQALTRTKICTESMLALRRRADRIQPQPSLAQPPGPHDKEALGPSHRTYQPLACACNAT